ncbi:MBL fold metallo-hydrolase [Cupriavidus necator]|uniref:MBL fold metallo-hydrolase n=1 Tax=Cupriavidus necator TaxID=106590 RepID=A0A1U9UW45_CUPNE|nr:MBL fold metallo-hydrolase [Cupriavidus necator]
MAASSLTSAFRTNLVLLGTAGGRTSYGGTTLAGISSALVVDGDVYLVDFGQGWLRRYLQAGLGMMPGKPGLSSLRAAFITHLHADHVMDYPALFLFGTTDGLAARKTPVRVFGPGPRGSLVPLSGANRTNVPVIHPEDPTPGTVVMTESIYKAFANDINDNIRDSQKPDPHTLVAVEDIKVPNGVVVDANRDGAPDMQPFPVYQDDKVKVTAILVSHAPVFPSFAFRFDTADGSVVFSGDTSPSQNLIRLAKGADVLVHEVIDTHWIDEFLPRPRNAAQEAKARHLLEAHTAVEAVGAVAQAGGVKTLVLSHLAPADSSESRWRRAQEGYSGRVVVGKDLMWLGIGAPVSMGKER